MSKELTDFFAHDEIEKLARESGFVQRDSTKINGSVFLENLIYTEFDQNKLSLNTMSCTFMDKNRIDISKQGVDQRFTDKSVCFLKLVMECFLGKIISKEPISDMLKDFTSIRIKDSTCFQLPDDMKEKYPGSGGAGSKASIRIQFEYDYKTGKIYDLSLHPFNKQDHVSAAETVNTIDANDLIIRDLGYISIAILLKIVSREAFYLNRLNAAKLFKLQGDRFEEIDWVAVKAYIKKKKLPYYEIEAYVGEEKSLKTRVIIELLPEAHYNERIRKASKEAKKKKRALSKDYKDRAALNIFITNIESKKLPADKVRTLYRLRWQIELIFKIWKSVGGIHKVKKMKVERFETLLYAKLLWISMYWFILWEINKEIWNRKKIQISPMKFFLTMKSRIYQSWQAIKAGNEQLAIFFTELYEMSSKKHRLEKKKGQLSSLEIQILFLTSK